MTLNEIKNECFSTVVDLYPLEILAVPNRDLFIDIHFEPEKQEEEVELDLSELDKVLDQWKKNRKASAS